MASIFLNFSFCRQFFVKLKVKQSRWFPIVSARYTTDPRETNACFTSNWSIFGMRLQKFVMSQ